MRACIPIPQNVAEVAARAMWGDDWEDAGRCYAWRTDMPDCAEAMAQVRLGLRAALAAWGAKVDDDDGHNDHFRLITGWSPKGVPCPNRECKDGVVRDRRASNDMTETVLDCPDCKGTGHG